MGHRGKKSSNSVVSYKKQGTSPSKEANGLVGKLTNPNAAPDDSSVSEFMTQVSDLVKLVDSKDIMEVQLKQMGYDFVIIKKEALEKPPVPPAASFIVPPNFQQTMLAQPSAAAATAPPSPAHSTSPAPKPVLPAPAKSGGSSHPPLKCSVAGTFYRSPAPSEPPFVKTIPVSGGRQGAERSSYLYH